MLKRSQRITSEHDFSQIYKKGKRATVPHLGLFYLLKHGSEQSRFGFVVSKKHSSKIVARNRIKRLLREGIRRDHSKIKPGYDVIITAKPGISKVAPNILREEMEKLLKKARLIE